MYNNILKKYGEDALSPADRRFLLTFCEQIGLKMESTYILLEYYKIHNPDKLSGLIVNIK